MKVVGIAALLATCAVASCDATRPEPPREVAPTLDARPAEPPLSSAPAASSSPASPTEPPEPPFVELAADGHPSAVVSIAERSASPATLVVATHGNFDRPEWQCEIFRSIATQDTFVLCPRGIARPDSPSQTDVRFTYANNQALEAEIEALRPALEARFGPRVASTPAIYAGFSLGAIMGVAILARSPAGRYDRAVLVEGGYDRIDATNAKAMAKSGIRKILFGCGQPACFHGAGAKAKTLANAGIDAKVVGSKKAGHTYDGDVARALGEAWPWLLEPAP